VDVGGLSTVDTLEIIEAAHSAPNDRCGDCRPTGQALHSGDVILLLRIRELSPSVKGRQLYVHADLSGSQCAVRTTPSSPAVSCKCCCRHRPGVGEPTPRTNTTRRLDPTVSHALRS
jgi:hypothetical protein